MVENDADTISLGIAKRWCAKRGPGWSVLDTAGRGGTAPVYSIRTPLGDRALKIYDERFSSGEEGQIQAVRVQMQVDLGEHECDFLVKVYEGGEFEDRLYVLMSLAPGNELEKCLGNIPRSKIRQIIDQIARAAIFLEQRGLCHRDIKSANIFISDDFEHATLLDVSVLRDINDPIGIGTDHGNQLPMVATARYSPPEYLFRLLDPSEQSWHALNVYQLGAVLHDLIMREPIFEDQYKIAGDNRYRFAWAVATMSPNTQANDVDRDLVNLAQRALDKLWQKRLSIKLSDFLQDTPARRENALRLIGFASKAADSPQTSAIPLRVIRPIADEIDDLFSSQLLDSGIRARHTVTTAVSPPAARISFCWSASASQPDEVSEFEFVVRLTGQTENQGQVLFLDGTLEMTAAGKRDSAQGSAPSMAYDSAVVPRAISALEELLGSLAMRLSHVDDGPH